MDGSGIRYLGRTEDSEPPKRSVGDQIYIEYDPQDPRINHESRKSKEVIQHVFIFIAVFGLGVGAIVEAVKGKIAGARKSRR